MTRATYVLCCSLSCLLSTSAVAQTPDVGSQISVSPAGDFQLLFRDYYRAFAAEDLTTLLGYWSDASPERDEVSRSTINLLRVVDYTFSEPQVSHVRVDGELARARVSVTREESGLAPGRRSLRLARSFTLINEPAGWRILHEGSAFDELAEMLVQKSDLAERQALLDADHDLVGPELMQTVLRLADRRHFERDLDSAVRGYETLVTVCERIGDEQLLSRALQNLGNISYVRQQFPEALGFYERRLMLEERLGNVANIASSLLAISTTHYSSGRYDLALPLYERVLEVEEAIGDVNALAMTWTSIGNVQYLQANFDGALEAYAKGLEYQRRIGDNSQIAALLYGRGRALAALGSFAAALDAHGQALTLRESLGEQTNIAASLLEIGRVQFLQGHFVAAASSYTRALAIEEASAHAAGRGRVLLALGLLRATEAKYAEALDAYKASVAAFEEAVEPSGVGYAWLGSGSVLVEQGTYEEALTHYHRALARFESLGNRVGAARALVGLAIGYTQLRQMGQAVSAASRAVAHATTSGASEVLWQAHYQNGRAYWMQGRRDLARTAFEESIRVLEVSRFETGTRSEEGRTVIDRLAPYTAMVEWFVSANQLHQAFELAERSKLRGLQDLLQQHRSRAHAGMSDEELAQERRLMNRRVSVALQRRRDGERSTRDRISELDARLEEARADFDAFQAQLQVTQTAVSEARAEVPPLNAEQLTSLVDLNTALLEYVVTDGGTFLFVLSRPVEAHGEPPATVRVDVYALPVTRSDLEKKAEDLRQLLETDDSGFRAAATELGTLLLGRAYERLASLQQWIVVPDGALWTVPFQALRTSSDRYVVQDAAVSYAPSARTLYDLKKRPRVRAAERLSTGINDDPTSSSTEASVLNGVDTATLLVVSTRINIEAVAASKEDAAEPRSSGIDALRTAYGADRVQIGDMSALVIEDRDGAVKSVDAAHVRVPVTLVDTSPLESSVSVGYEAWELLSSRLASELLVLEHVETPPESRNQGEGMVGLTWATFAAGGRSVILDFTPGGDPEREGWSARIHRYLATNTTSPAAALRQATLDLLGSDETVRPRAWAERWLVGEP